MIKRLYVALGKPILDWVGSFVGIILSLPLAALIALAITTESRGGFFYTQERIGRDGVPFRIFKFRSMLRPQDSYDSEGELMENYNRVTKVGRILRSTSLDELPQLLNVLKGEMSLIGPRPTLGYQVERYTEEQMRRLEVKPGLTGLAQVSGRNSLTWNQKIALDLHYVRTLSPVTDLKIFMKTLVVVFRREGTAFVAHDALSSHEGGDSSAVWKAGR